MNVRKSLTRFWLGMGALGVAALCTTGYLAQQGQVVSSYGPTDQTMTFEQI